MTFQRHHRKTILLFASNVYLWSCVSCFHKHSFCWNLKFSSDVIGSKTFINNCWNRSVNWLLLHQTFHLHNSFIIEDFYQLKLNLRRHQKGIRFDLKKRLILRNYLWTFKVLPEILILRIFKLIKGKYYKSKLTEHALIKRCLN